MTPKQQQFPHGQPGTFESPGGDSGAWLGGLKLGVELPERELHLYARYVRALSLLCECAPYVDDEDYSQLIDELLADACKHYALECRHDGDFRAIALREQRKDTALVRRPEPDKRHPCPTKPNSVARKPGPV